jgi:sulfite reductase (NADPH) hemoprotein beta-component
MYRYDQYDQAIVDARVAEFRDQVARRMAGEITEEEFKPLRLKNGLYMQLHAYMLRVAIPYGTLDSRQLRMLAHIARKYDRDYGHFTTRQNIQYNWIKLAEMPDLLADLASVEMHAIQTSGNCIRNITSDQFAGAAADEVVDPRIYGELLRQWSTFHPEFSHLPRKFKIALTASTTDRAAIKLHDIGYEIVRNEAGDLGFRVNVGGGMGRTPFVAPVIREFLPEQHFLSYAEAIMRVYNRHGRRDNIYKARIKILVHDLGADEFARQVEAEWQDILPLGLDAPQAEVERIAAFFAPPPLTPEDEGSLPADAAFQEWVKRSVFPHKVPGHAIVTISLKPVGGIPGDASADQMDLIADLAQQLSHDEVRVTHEQNLVLPHVKRRDLYRLWQVLEGAGLGTANAGLVTDIIACPGLDYCSLANARSIPIGQQIALRFASFDRQRDLGELKIKISGCINGCGHHHAGHIGILGVDRKGEENYQILLGGSGAEDTTLASILGPGFSAEGVVDAVEAIIERYRAIRTPGERFLDTYRRVGKDPFKEAAYGQRAAA